MQWGLVMTAGSHDPRRAAVTNVTVEKDPSEGRQRTAGSPGTLLSKATVWGTPG